MKKSFALAIALTTLLTGCETAPDIKSTLGLKKSAPDEFMVISNPPLTTPPDFSLTAPDSENVRFNNVVTEPKVIDNSDKEFLNKLGNKSDSTIKREIDESYNKEKKLTKEKGAIRKTLEKVSGGKKDPIVDPIAEKKRISENLESGKPVNEGDVKLEKKSTINHILGN